ncbi:anthranilate synthase component II [Staphylococcus intermedius]|uniref:Para-aminobenzoate/anthranilate synthase glutamine amidotransferase component II n=1 Tax=Staphylococcus intermedius NCTC 11048 TaxID=1141106 RepID=A0A380G8V0_STAIN|nr:aminodeoxychorismate/anthranilate synthase component II [Staphylococcus intermedius]PCF81160.1 aminodeoxychorismate/anthranilate synthase component II [Staphylococcus intermedius]PCF87142.1 aminodeoxychorismate/anthranilate synthase component II [Staphylococcus intermedius]PCF87701.1 aminodeoxychorismate/anthranilate synthase component II [Staphylococcus intermedius]PNZ54188.1 type 1 glutamine amidotransferase [Staphylococcus intermedius NCTC 11048]SUM47505.1 para-aminobenzoate/anthranilate
MIVMIDNQDSFTYNIVDYVEYESQQTVTVIDVEAVSIAALKEMEPTAIIISPGPGAPEDYPILFEVVKAFEATTPILGVCLGFQLLVTYYGGKIIHAPRPVHGHTTRISHDQSLLFHGLPEQFEVMRYHSLMADPTTIEAPLVVSAQNEDGIVMAVRHMSRPIDGVQYHPESILSEYGHEQIRNFLRKAGVHHGCEV